jgi:carboxypeptidase C (cathepsin A)
VTSRLCPAAELFLSGESYAGFYIPWIAEHIVSKQLVQRHDDVSGEAFYERDVTGTSPAPPSALRCAA